MDQVKESGRRTSCFLVSSPCTPTSEETTQRGKDRMALQGFIPVPGGYWVAVRLRKGKEVSLSKENRVLSDLRGWA